MLFRSLRDTPPRLFLPTPARTSPPTQFCRGASLIGRCSVRGQFGSLERVYVGGLTQTSGGIWGKQGVLPGSAGGGAGRAQGRLNRWRVDWETPRRASGSTVPAHLRLPPGIGAGSEQSDPAHPGAWGGGFPHDEISAFKRRRRGTRLPLSATKAVNCQPGEGFTPGANLLVP